MREAERFHQLKQGGETEGGSWSVGGSWSADRNARAAGVPQGAWQDLGLDQKRALALPEQRV